MLDMATIVNGSVSALRNSAWFPYDTGNLKYNATYGDMHLSGFGVGIIKFDATRAPYIDFLEYGTKFSSKHKNFIADKSVKAVIDYICQITGGEVGTL